MQYKVVYSRRFIKALKRVQNLPGFRAERLTSAIELLSVNKQLPEQFRDHALLGDMSGYREFHIAPDILVIYEVQDEILELLFINIGTHSHLFR